MFVICVYIYIYGLLDMLIIILPIDCILIGHAHDMGQAHAMDDSCEPRGWDQGPATRGLPVLGPGNTLQLV